MICTQYEKIRIEITGACNLRCRTCHAADRSAPEAIRVELTTGEILSLIKEATELGVKEVDLIGGEPFLHKDIWEIIDACPGMVTICTNGHFFTDDNLVMLQKRQKVREFCVSIDGVEAHDRIRVGSRLALVLEGLRRLKVYLPEARVFIQTTCTQGNIAELMDLYQLLCDKAITPHTWSVNLFWKAGRGVENYPDLRIDDWRLAMQRFAELIVRHREEGRPFVLNIYNTYNSLIADETNEDYEEYIHMDSTVHPCAYHASKLCVRADGAVEFCNSLHCISANIRDTGSLRAAIKSNPFNEFYALSIGDLRVCPTCRYVQLCGGGCRGDAITHLQDIKQPDPIACIMMPLVEEIIMPILTDGERARYRQLIRADLTLPPCGITI